MAQRSGDAGCLKADTQDVLGGIALKTALTALLRQRTGSKSFPCADSCMLLTVACTRINMLERRVIRCVDALDWESLKAWVKSTRVC